VVRVRTTLLILCLSALAVNSATAQELVVAQIASKTNPISANNAIGLALGFETYFSVVNAAGGINGHRVVLQNFDDNASVSESLDIIAKVAADNRIIALFGQSTSGQLSEIVKKKILLNADLALVAPLSGIPALAEAKNVFPVQANYFDEIDKIASHLGSTYKKKVAFLYLNNLMGKDMQDRLATGMKKFDGVVTTGIGISSIPDKAQMTLAVEAATDQALATQPDAIVAFAPGRLGPDIVRRVRAKNGQLTYIYLMSNSGYNELLKSVSIDSAKWVMISEALPMPTDIRRKIVKQYMTDLARHAPQAKPSYLSLEGYIAARILHEAIRRAGASPTRSSVLAALDTMGTFDTGNFEVNYSATSKSVDASAVEITMISASGALIH